MIKTLIVKGRKSFPTSISFPNGRKLPTYEKVFFTHKPQKPIMFAANASKNAQGYCQPSKDFKRYKLPLHTHHEDHFYHPKLLKLVSNTHC